MQGHGVVDAGTHAAHALIAAQQAQAAHGFAKTMLAGAAISVLGTVVSVIWAPETRGYTLAETGSVDFKGR